MFHCCFPGCPYETGNRSLIEFHHIHPRELFTRVGKHVTIPLCPTHHKLIYHENATSGQHAEKHPESMMIKQVADSNRGKCVIFEDMEGNEHTSYLDNAPSTGILSISWNIVDGITEEESTEIPYEFEPFVETDGFYDDGSTVYFKSGYEKIAKALLAKHVESYMTKTKSEFDLALKNARNDWLVLKNKA